MFQLAEMGKYIKLPKVEQKFNIDENLKMLINQSNELVTELVKRLDTMNLPDPLVSEAESIRRLEEIVTKRFCDFKCSLSFLLTVLVNKQIAGLGETKNA